MLFFNFPNRKNYKHICKTLFKKAFLSTEKDFVKFNVCLRLKQIMQSKNNKYPTTGPQLAFPESIIGLNFLNIFAKLRYMCISTKISV